MSKFVTLGVLMVLAVPAVAQSPAQTAAQVQPQTSPNSADKIVCRTEETTGTRLGAHKVCAKLSEWREQAEQSQQATQKIQQQDSGVCGEGCGN